MKHKLKFRSMGAAVLALAAVALITPILLKTTNKPAFAQSSDTPQTIPTCVGESSPNSVMTVQCNGPIDIEVHTDREIFITNTCVVNDPCRTRWDTGCHSDVQGAWTFGKLMASVAGFRSIDEDPFALSQFVTNWMMIFMNDQVVNGFTVEDRDDIFPKVLEKWQLISGSDQLNMRLAPFRLTAIVNRLDLRTAVGPYGTGNAGEGRLVFVFLDIVPGLPPEQWQPIGGAGAGGLATVIFEYELVANTCGEVQQWADAWHSLGTFNTFDEPYRRALQSITDKFAGFGANPGAPNDSALAQLRTNEIAFDPRLSDGDPNTIPVWEMREFDLFLSYFPYPPAYVLDQQTVAQTVDLTFNDDDFAPPDDVVKQNKLGQWMTQNEVPLNHNNFVIPLRLSDNTPFNAGSALNPGTGALSNLFWDVLDNFDFDCSQTRHNFALASCMGCHARESDVANFRQVTGRVLAEPALLSEFLTGVPGPNDPDPEVGTTDPTCPQPPLPGAVTRQFNDILRRALDLCDLLNTPCSDSDALLAADMAIFHTDHMGEFVH